MTEMRIAVLICDTFQFMKNKFLTSEAFNKHTSVFYPVLYQDWAVESLVSVIREITSCGFGKCHDSQRKNRYFSHNSNGILQERTQWMHGYSTSQSQRRNFTVNSETTITQFLKDARNENIIVIRTKSDFALYQNW